jgi:hypothetical protein
VTRTRDDIDANATRPARPPPPPPMMIRAIDMYIYICATTMQCGHFSPVSAIEGRRFGGRSTHTRCAL